MAIDVLAPESDFITALTTASEFRRGLVRDGHAAASPADALLASRSSLALLVNTLFWTSVAAEEGRPVVGSLCICSPAEAPRSRAFDSAVALTSRNLIALLTASPEAPLAVHLEGKDLQVWGVLDSRTLGGVSLRIGGPGTIVALKDRATVALLHEGCVHVLGGLPHESTGLALLLMNTLDPKNSFPERLRLASSLTKAVVAMHGHHHGGAIVITPVGGDDWRESVDLRFAFAPASTRALADPPSDLEQARSAGNAWVADVNVVDANLAMLHKTLRAVGQLTAIDGAVVLTEDLVVLGFGAKLNCPAANFTVSRFNATTQELRQHRPISEVGGTRHQSAARFVQRHHECAVVASSQDGRLTLFAWVRDPGNVVALSGLEHFVWGELL